MQSNPCNSENVAVKLHQEIPDSQSGTIGKLIEALCKAQAAMKPAIKDSENPYFKSKYADLKGVWESIRQPLTDNNLAVVQTTRIADNRVVIVTTLAHSSGEWMRGELAMTPVKNTPQEVGSAITYARRYALAAIVGAVSDDDDDGNAASGKTATSPTKSPNTTRSNPPAGGDTQGGEAPRITKAIQTYIEAQVNKLKVDREELLQKLNISSFAEILLADKDKVIQMVREMGNGTGNGSRG